MIHLHRLNEFNTLNDELFKRIAAARQRGSAGHPGTGIGNRVIGRKCSPVLSRNYIRTVPSPMNG